MKLLKISFVLFVLCLIGIFGCHKNQNHTNNSGALINIQGFELTDFSGNLIGWQGTPDSDWLIRPTLSAAEMAVLNFNTNVNLNNTTADTIAGVLAFPNPAWNEQLFYCRVNDSNVIKVVYVDSMLRVLKDTAVKGKGTVVIPMLLTDPTLFPDHTSRRIYFSFSANGHPDYAVGYGDVRMCSQVSGAAGAGAGNCF
ncbi:MAG TPA: hypothetical protein VGS79_15075 [Puia sp.]|nr:hypothetical protein [Puia sp.]